MGKRNAFLLTFFTLLLSGECALSHGAGNPRETPVVKVVKEWASSVVNISTERVILLRSHPFWGSYGGAFDAFFENYQKSAPITAMKLQSLGSGVIVSKEGLIATNAHVIHMASKIFVTLNDGTVQEAKLVGASPQDDVALIQISAPYPLKPMKFAKDVLIGETVVTIGNPFGLENSVSAGVVSGRNRNFYNPQTQYGFFNLIQTDASINPGSSGGALLNLNGELAGINLAVVEHAQNIGFAIPAEKVKKILKEYEAAGGASPPKNR